MRKTTILTKTIAMATIAAVLCICACGSKDVGEADKSFEEIKNQMVSDGSADAADTLSVQDTSVSDSSAGEGREQQDEQGPQTIDFSLYDGMEFTQDYDNSKVTMSGTGDSAVAHFVVDKGDDGNGDFYTGDVVLTVDQATSGDGKFYFRGVPSKDGKVTVDIDFSPDGTMLFAMYRDDGGYASHNLLCQELADKLLGDATGTTGDLADYIGGYRASNGDSFTIEDRNDMVRLYDLDLSSIDGWQDYDGGYPVDKRNEDGVFVVDIITQYTAAEGNIKIRSDGSIEMELHNVNTANGVSDYSNTFTKTSEDVTDTSNELLKVFTEGRIDCTEDNKLFINFGTAEKGYWLRFLAFEASADTKAQFSDETLTFRDSDLYDGTGQTKVVQVRGSKHEDCTYTCGFDTSGKTIVVTVTTGSGDTIIRHFTMQ